MSAIEFVGFVISFIAMIVLFFRRTLEKRRYRANPELYEQMEKRKEERLKEFLRGLDVQHDGHADEEEEEEEDDEGYIAPPPPVRTVAKQAPYRPAAINTPQRRMQDGSQFRAPIEQLRKHAPIEKHQQPTSIGDSYKDRFSAGSVGSTDLLRDLHTDAYALNVSKENNRVSNILARLETPKDMIILHEVIGPPKALR